MAHLVFAINVANRCAPKNLMEEEFSMLRTALLLLATVFAIPAFAQIPVKSYGQALVDEVVARNPGLLVIVIHVTPPNSPDNVIVASNIGRIGKKGDEDDMRVINTGKSNLEVAHGGERFEVELVLQDVGGDTIGALGLVFPFKAGVDKKALEKRAIRIRDGLKRRISTTGNLLEPFPFDPLATTKNHAQKLVDAAMARHPDLQILVMHVTPPNARDNIILASSIGRHGKKADEDDMRVINTGKPNLEVNATGKRFEVELVLQDQAGKTIGALGTVFAYKDGDDKSKLQKKAELIRDELRKQIPSIEKLAELDP